MGRHGCTVKALRCVLWTCHMDLLVPSKAKEFKNKMWKIFIEAAQLNLLVARGSMEDSIENACSIYLKKKRYDEYLPKITELTEEVTTLG